MLVITYPVNWWRTELQELSFKIILFSLLSACVTLSWPQNDNISHSYLYLYLYCCASMIKKGIILLLKLSTMKSMPAAAFSPLVLGITVWTIQKARLTPKK